MNQLKMYQQLVEELQPKRSIIMADGAEQVLQQAELDNGEQVRLVKGEFKGKFYLHIRKYYNDEGQWKPGKGFSMAFTQPNLEALQAICEVAGKLKVGA